MSVPIPDNHLDLLTRPIHGVLTTMMADGQPHSSLVWCDYDGGCARVNTTRQRQKGRDMLANPKVSLLVVDPEHTARYLAIRGEVELIEEGAIEHLDQLTRYYTSHPHYYGSIYPVEQQAQETCIICRHLLHPCHQNHPGCHSYLTLPFSQDRSTTNSQVVDKR